MGRIATNLLKGLARADTGSISTLVNQALMTMAKQRGCSFLTVQEEFADGLRQHNMSEAEIARILGYGEAEEKVCSTELVTE
jgi:hypothetical protein